MKYKFYNAARSMSEIFYNDSHGNCADNPDNMENKKGKFWDMARKIEKACENTSGEGSPITLDLNENEVAYLKKQVEKYTKKNFPNGPSYINLAAARFLKVLNRKIEDSSDYTTRNYI